MCGGCVRLACFAMATRFEILLEGEDPARLRAAGEEALAEIESLDRRLSRFRPDSDVSRINAHAATGPVKVEPRLFRLLERAQEISDLTDGAFDVTIGPLMSLWGFAGEGRVPSRDEIESALKVVGARNLILYEPSFTVAFRSPGMGIDLGAIGKGCAIDAAVECLREAGICRALVHGGTSTVYGIGRWEVGIGAARLEPVSGAQALHRVRLADSALSVSAVYGRSFERDGRRFGHVIDPRTGEPVSHTKRAAVWGPSATDCDALSTALLVLGESWLPELKARFAGYEGLVSG